MILAIVTLIVLILLIIVLFVLLTQGVFEEIQTGGPQADAFINSITRQHGFCTPDGKCDGSPVAGERGKCQLYRTFSSETEIIDTIPPEGEVDKIPADLACDDGFVKALQKRTRECLIDECTGIDGKRYKKEEKETSYFPCANLKKCKNPRSAIILDFVPGKKSPSVFKCIAADEDKYWVTPCPSQVTIDDNVFLNIEQIPITDFGVTAVRIRAPGSVNCLVPKNDKISIAPCEGEKNEGFTWAFIPLPGAELSRIPSLIVDSSGKFDDAIKSFKNAAGVVTFLIFSGIKSIQLDPSAMGQIAGFSLKEIVAKNIVPPPGIAIISALGWEQTFST